VAGLDGAQGPQGIQGPQGEQGPQGPAGADGSSIVFDGEWLAGTSYVRNHVVTYNGETFIANVDNTDANNNPSIVNADWLLIAAKGADGAQGAKGDTGATGPQGEKGDTGAAGAQGPIGLTGPEGPMGPQGPQGGTGAQGAQGLQGVAGANGTNGYQILAGGSGVSGIRATSSGRYAPWGYGMTSSDIDDVAVPVPLAGTLSLLNMRLNGRPSSSSTERTYWFTVFKNGVATSLTCAVVGTSSTITSNTCSNVPGTAAVAAGDSLALQIVGSSPNSSSMGDVTFTWSVKLQ
jgi:hypothetical protein